MFQGLILLIHRLGDVAQPDWTTEELHLAGHPEEIRVTAGDQTLRHYPGTWAALRFVMSGTEISQSYTNLRWDILQSDGSPLTINGQAGVLFL